MLSSRRGAGGGGVAKPSAIVKPIKPSPARASSNNGQPVIASALAASAKRRTGAMRDMLIRREPLQNGACILVPTHQKKSISLRSEKIKHGQALRYSPLLVVRASVSNNQRNFLTIAHQ